MSTNYTKDSLMKSQADCSESQPDPNDLFPEPDELPEPTVAPAGSLEKVEVLRRRFAANQKLWHPDDEERIMKRC